MKGEFENRLRGVIDEVKAVAEADHPVHRRGASADRRRRFGRTGRCRQPAEAGAGPRRAAHHRGDHLGGIQEILREGRGADPALPGGEGRGAAGTDGGRHGARAGRHAGEAPQRPHPRRGGERGGAAVGTLHPVRQLPDKAVSLIDTACARVGDEPGGGAAADRGPPAAHCADRHRGRHSRPRDRCRRAASRRGARTCWAERTKLAQELDRARGALGAGEAPGGARSARRAPKIEDPANTEDKDALRAKLTGTIGEAARRCRARRR